ncbi:MAG: baseplate J/gp47 family protein [Clostridiales Family XIII bacterium]|jgi:hypothetical protein|nr:baseplate J/gp47 family protein [Clostridiales Family XIII bacterium]
MSGRDGYKLERYLIDPRRADDLLAEIAARAASYTPEWVFDPKNPDIGSVLTILFAGQMSGSIDRLNQLVNKYRMEFVNMLNVGLLPASPATGVCVFDLVQNVVPGVDMPSGVRLLGYDEEATSAVVFETLSHLHVTNASVSDVAMSSSHFGKIIPLRGTATAARPAWIPAPASGEDSEQANDAIRLFDFSEEGVGQNALLLYHENAFDVPPRSNVFVEVFAPDGKPLADTLADSSAYRWSYFDGAGFTPFTEAVDVDGVLSLRRDGAMEKTPIRGDVACDVVRVDAVGPVNGSLDLGNILIHSSAVDTPPDFANNNEADLPVGEFMPFGNTASLFDDCYIGSDSVFSHDGAEITLRFSLSYRDKLVTFTPEQEAADLKIIKPKPRQIVFTTAHTRADRVSAEYFNGTGWCRLTGDEQWATIFDGSVSGPVELTFTCPQGWEPISIGANTGRCVRLRIESADNCYLQPCVHHMPLVHGFSISYEYTESKKQPTYMERLSGVETVDLTRAIAGGVPFTAFEAFPSVGNNLYIGLDSKPGGRPLSLYFALQGSARRAGVPLRFEYSTGRGFTHMRVEDGTDGFSKSGVVTFNPGDDFTFLEQMGLSRCWIRIVDAEGFFDEAGRYHPIITDIIPNAVAIHNVQTLDEDVFYVDEAAPNMSFRLSSDNILSADVYVNERNLPKPVIEKMIAEEPERVRVEYDERGEVSGFHVLWNEVDNFDGSAPGDRHYVIDRLHNTIRFGDGIGVRIPAASSEPAFTVRVRRCDGATGNLPAGSLTDLMDRVLYVGDVFNPLATSGGSDMESVALAMERVSGVVNSGGRLVSERDYERETLNFSEMIGSARCIVESPLTHGEFSLNIALLMRDYLDGSYSFENVRDGLVDRIRRKCEATLTADCIRVTEPTFVRIDVDVWVFEPNKKARYDTAALIRERVAERLDPLPREDARGTMYGGWRIGEMPAPEQIEIMLYGISGDAVIKRFTATANYIDKNGERRSCELSRLKREPFMVGVNGKHKVHFL